MKKLKEYSPVLLRIAIAIILLWFAFSQLKNPSGWIKMVPQYALSIGFSAKGLIYTNAIIELILGILILIGLYTRVASFLIGLHLLHITTILGYGAIAVRDFVIALVAFAIFLNGPDSYCLDRYLFSKVKIHSEEY